MSIFLPFRLMSQRGRRVTQFNQSLGAELLTNGNFTAWSGGNPTGWTVTGEVGSDPAVNEVAPGGGAGTGAAQFFSSATPNVPTLSQVALTANTWYESALSMTAHTAGLANPIFVPRLAVQSLNGLMDLQSLGLANNVTWSVSGTSSVPINYVLDDFSCRAISLNTAYATGLNQQSELYFNLVPSPVVGMLVALQYRIASVNNFWIAYMWRGTGGVWFARLDSVSSGGVTNRINANVGATLPDAIRVRVVGDVHQLFTLSGTTWTQRGTNITNTTHNSASGVRPIYSSAFTPSLLTSGAA